MSGTPFFSVIIPTFNRAHLLAKAIQSVLDQTFTDWELIIVDDGSTDETAAVVRSFGDGRIRYYYQENQGKSISRNRGIDLSTGIYISFLDDDDYYLETFLGSFEKFIKANMLPIAFFMCNESVLRQDRSVIPNKIPIELIRQPVHLLWKIQSSIRPFTIHRKILDQLRFQVNCPFGQDFHLIIRIALNYPMYYVPFIGCVNVQHNTTGSRKKFTSNLRKNAYDSLTCLDDLMEKNDKLFELIPINQIYAQRNHLVYGFASAAMKKGEIKLFNDLTKQFTWKSNQYKKYYYLVSLFLRIPFYYLQSLLIK